MLFHKKPLYTISNINVNLLEKSLNLIILFSIDLGTGDISEATTVPTTIICFISIRKIFFSPTYILLVLIKSVYSFSTLIECTWFGFAKSEYPSFWKSCFFSEVLSSRMNISRSNIRSNYRISFLRSNILCAC